MGKVTMWLATWLFPGWLSSSTGVVLDKGGDISLCHLLENDGRERRTGFPIRYICTGPDNMSSCAPTREWPTAPFFRSADADNFQSGGGVGVHSDAGTVCTRCGVPWATGIK